MDAEETQKAKAGQRPDEERERERAVETEVERGAVGGGRQPAGETAAAVGRRLGGCAKEGVD